MAVVSPAPQRTRLRRPPAVTATPPLVSVIIVNYRRWAETAALVEQLVGHEHLFGTRFEVIVIDNASPADPVEEQLRKDDRLQFERLPCNRGFSAGVNAGFAKSKGEWLLVLNPDLITCEGFIDLIAATALDVDVQPWGEPPIGVVGFQLRNRDGTRQYSTGLFPTVGRMVLGLLRPRRHRKYQFLDVRERHRVPWVTGSCLLVRSNCFHQLAGFDEEFFLYYEDVDLCRRATEQGWAVCYDPAVQAIHLDPLQNRPLNATMRAITRHASLTYFSKHVSGWQFRTLTQIIRAEAWLRQTLATLRGRSDEAWIHRELRGMCRDLVHNQPLRARERLEEVLRRSGMQK